MSDYFRNSFAELVWRKKYARKFDEIDSFFDFGVGKISNVLREEFERKGRTPGLISDRVDNLLDMLNGHRFLFGGRILAAFGDPNRKVSLYNCTCINILDDSLEGIMDAMKKVAKVSSRGQGVGVDFSVLRPRGATVNSAAFTSTGAVSFMQLFDQLGDTLVQDGDSTHPARRMAMLFTLSVDHPDVIEFIYSKQDAGKITNANISVIVSEKFLNAVANNEMWDLKWGGKVYNRIPARDLMRMLSESNRISAEPGVLFLETAKRTALPEWLGFPIVGFNGCTEASLDYAGLCNLGSLNLGEYVDINTMSIDWNKLERDVQSAVIALDTIITMEFKENRVPVEEQRTSQHNLRRVGLGVMGLADMLALLNIRYGSLQSVTTSRNVMKFITEKAYETSVFLSETLGKAPAVGAYLQNPIYGPLSEHPFISRLDTSVKNGVDKFGLRNAMLISIAPTGSISNVVGCTSGVEPLYRKEYTRYTRINGSGYEPYYYIHPMYERYPDALWVEAKDVTPEQKLNVIAAIQEFVDQAISNTGNFPAGTTAKQIEDYYYSAYKRGIKGLTVYVENAITKEIRGAILEDSQQTAKESSPKIESYAEPVIEMSLYQGASCKIGADGLSRCD